MKYNFPPFISKFDKILGIINLNKGPNHLMGKQFEKHGPFYSLESKFLNDKIIFTKNPDLIKRILQKKHKKYDKSFYQADVLRKYLGKGLLTNTGKSWLKQRRLIQPGFNNYKIESLFDLMFKEVKTAFDDLPKNESINIYQTFNKLAFNVVAKTLFSSNISQKQIDNLSEVITESQKLFIKETRTPFFMFFYKASGYVKKTLKKIEENRKTFQDLINERRNSNTKQNDLLDVLLDARYEDNGKPMNDEQLIDELLILFIAGFETSANALSFTFYLLGKNPTNKKKLIKEIEDLEEDIFNLSTFFKPSYTQLVIKESMRLYPPAWIFDRVALEDDEFEGYNWNKGTVVIGNMFLMNREESIWNNADKFTPERFSEPDIKSKPYIPFGSGPRFCIGEHFAMMEMILVLRYFYKNYDFELETKNIKLIPLITLRPKEIIGKIIPK